MTHSSHNIAPGSCFCIDCTALMGADREDLLAPCRGKQRVIDNYDAWQKKRAAEEIPMTEQQKGGGFDLAQMIADREAGTPGEWFINGPTWNQIVWTDNETRLCFMTHSNGLNDARDEANARRIARVPLLEAEIIRLTARVAELEGAGSHVLHDIDDLAGNSEGVAGLHQNGDLAPWDSLLAGGSFEAWLASVETLRAALSTHTEEPKT